MTDVRLSITLDADQAKRAAQDFRAGFKALTSELQQPLGQVAALNQVKVGAMAATNATISLNSAYGQQQATLSGLSLRQEQAAAATRRLAADQHELAGAAAKASQAVAQQARTAGAGAVMGGSLGATVRGAIGAYASVQTVAAIASTADAYNLMVAKLKLATSSQEEFNTAQQELQRIAEANAAPVASLVGLYGRLSTPLKEAGRTQGEILKVIEAVSASFRVSGATAQEAEGAILQFAQALGSGALRGDEFNSVAEQAPRLMTALAAGLGVARSSLKGMAEEGKLTASVVTDALISQLDKLRTESASMPETVGGAMTALRDEVNKAVGGTNLQPLIDSLHELRRTVSDPGVAEGIGQWGSAMTRIGSIATGVASDLGLMVAELGRGAAQLTNNITRLDEIDGEMKAIENTLNGWSVGDVLVDLFYSDEELKAKLEVLKQERAKLLEEQSGMNAALGAQQTAANAAAEAQAKQKRESLQKHADEMKKVRDQLLKDAEAALKAEKKAETDALRDLERIKQDRLKLEQEFNSSIASTRAGGAQEPSYGAAQDLKLNARKSLAARDPQAAIEQARAALRVLEQLEAAGANTYGFEGFKAELRDIALAAKDLEQTRAEDKIAVIGSNIALLEQKTAELEKVEITPSLSDAAVTAVTAQLQALAAALGQTLTIPVRLVPTGTAADAASGATPDAPEVVDPLKRATGGWIDGPGTPTSDSIMLAASRGEYVLNARAAATLGAANLDFMNRSGQLPMRDHLIPQIPTMPSLDRIGERQPLNLAMPWGGSYALEGTPTEVQRLQDDLRRTARKFGGTRA